MTKALHLLDGLAELGFVFEHNQYHHLPCVKTACERRTRELLPVPRREISAKESVYFSAEIKDIVSVMNAIETTGIVDEQHQLRLDEPLPIAESSRVRVIVLVSEAEDREETAWTRAVAASPAFDFLKEEAEDIYTRTDGKPFHDQR